MRTIEEQTRAERFSVAVCICTRNRPLDLAKALESVERSETAVSQVIVSDDSTDDRSRLLVAERFPDTLFIEGPRKGLCANRNNALRAARGSHVIFIDDDALLGRTFIGTVQRELAQVPEPIRGRTIVSGLERKNGELVHPSDQDFLGFQQRSYHASEALNTVVINATIFPLELFERIGFDINLVYGCDEVDLTTRAVALGFPIVLCRDAVNEHYPSAVNRDFYAAHVNASRIYVTFKRYLFTDRNYLRALLFAVIGPLHLLGMLLKCKGRAAFGATFATLAEASSYLLKYLRERPDSAPIAARVRELQEVT